MNMNRLRIVLIAIICACAHGLIHHLKIHSDDRNVFKIETFGFLQGGEMNVTISNFNIKLTKKEKTIFVSNSTDLGIIRRLDAVNASAPARPAAPVRPAAPATAPTAPTTPVATAPVVPAPVSAPNPAPAPAPAPVAVPVSAPTPAEPKPAPAPAPAPPKPAPAPPKSPAKSPAKPTPVKANATVISYKVGFVMRRALSESAAQQDLERIIENGLCIFDHLEDADVVISMNSEEKWKRVSVLHEVDEKGPGLYSLIFARCVPSGAHLVNFNLDATFYNPGPNYLSAGDTPLPSMYFSFFLAFTAALVAWVWILRRDPAAYGTVHRIHYMMLVLLCLKVASLLFESVRYHYIAMFGVSETWSIVYYIFAFLKGVMLFTVILLIGSGWSLMKSYLNGQEKKIIFVVLILQVLDNIAMIVLEESAPGSQGWLTWRDVLHLVDIVCCVAILLPIVWSIRHLRLAAEVDGKAHNSLVKLQLFRQFYVMVVVYIYFTRIVVYLISSTVTFHMLWLGPFSTEAATLIFYVVTGFKFRPALDNPYLAVRTEDLEGGDYGLEEPDEGLELQLK